MDNLSRPNPEFLLEKIKNDEKNKKKGKLKIFLGYSPGVGKTYAMLDSAHGLRKAKIDVVLGYIEPHTRPDTMELVSGLEKLEPKEINYKGIFIKEFDLEEALKRKPQVILVDELAHTNSIGSRHNKRWQDIMELLDSGIDVYTTVNIQHIESLNDIIASITGVFVKETVPDKVLDIASQVELIDIEPDNLLRRFNEGKVYRKDQAERAQMNFFSRENLFALREIALRKTADRVNKDVELIRLSKSDIKVVPTKEQILVCISPSPSSSKVIRTASRMAESLQAEWIAVYIQSSRVLDSRSREQLRRNITLAEELGAKVSKITGDDVAEQLVQYAKIRNITKLIIGKNVNNKKGINYLLHKNIVDKVLELSSFMEIHIIPGNPEDYQANNKLPKEKKSYEKIVKGFSFSSLDLFKVFAVTGFATMIAFVFFNFKFAEANIIMVYIVGALIISMITRGYFIGFIGSLVSVLAFNYFFTEPRYSFYAYDRSYYATFPIMFLVALISSYLTSRVQQQIRKVQKKEETTQILYDISRNFLNIVGKDKIAIKGISYIAQLIKKDALVYLTDNNGKLLDPMVDEFEKDLAGLFSDNEKAVVNWVYKNGESAGFGTHTLPGSLAYYVPLKSSDKILGVIGLRCKNEALDIEQKNLLESVIAQMSMALERENFFEEQERAKLDIAREKLRNDLLRSISHDLRTPLATIQGATTTVLENIEYLDKYTIKDLLGDINSDVDWLIRLIENLLSITKIDEGKLNLNKTPEVLEDIIYETIRYTGKIVKEHHIKVITSDELLLAPVDAKLVQQVLINLIDNAVKYTNKGSLIKIHLFAIEDKAVIEVSDNGGGIPEESLPQIFDKFYTLNNSSMDSRRGIGLGLSICKSIMEAHGGTITAYNNKTGGASFKLSFPIE